MVSDYVKARKTVQYSLHGTMDAEIRLKGQKKLNTDLDLTIASLRSESVNKSYRLIH